jgi:glycosyltransferase involved in cell wall biosynthesis
VASKEEIPVLQLVNQFAVGGAEEQFIARLRGHPAGFRPVVACINKAGPHLAEVAKLGLAVEEFGLKGKLAQLNTGHQIVKLAAFLEREGVKLIHANDFYANVLAVPAARLVGARVICSRFDLGHWYSRAHHMVEALACKSADAVYVNAEAVRALCVDEEGVPPERVCVVRNGIDLPAFDAAALLEPVTPIPAGRPTIAVIGNLYPVKGHLELVEAVERVRHAVPDVLVLCAGEGPMRATVEQQIAERGLKDSVLLLGHRFDVPALLARSNVACLASHAEGLSNALIEAMAASLPVVATAVGGNVELVRDGGPDASGHLVAAHNPALLAERLVSLLREPERARALGAAGRKRVVAELTLPVMSQKTGELYRRVLAGQPARAESKAA